MFFVSRVSDLAVLGLVACGLAAPMSALAEGLSRDQRKKQQVVYINWGEEPPSMDPTKQADQVSGTLLGHIYEGLMTTDAKGNLTNGVAESYTMSPDGKTWTFKLRKSAKWQDGKPVTAKDFEYTFRRLVDPKYASQYSFMASTAQILNASDIINGKKPVSELGVRAVDDSTFEVKLAAPVAFFLRLMRFQIFFPVRKDLVEKHRDKFNTEANMIIGNGPFKMTLWKHEAEVRLEKSETYWNKNAIKLSSIEAPVLLKDNGSAYNLYNTGGLDMTGLDKERLKIAEKDKQPVKFYADGSGWYLELNQRKGKVFANKNLRQAMRFAINRQEYTNKIVGVPGTKPWYGIVPSFLPGAKLKFRQEHRLQWKDGDVATAKSYISKYLAETGQKAVPAFSLLNDDTETAKMQGEYLQNYLAKVFGNKITLENVPFKTRLQKMRDGDFDVVFAGWGPDYEDPMTFVDLFLSTNENNHAGYASAKYDQLVHAAMVEMDPVKRSQLMADAEKLLIVEDATIVPFFERGRAYLSASGLKGVVRQQIGADPDLRFAHWE